MTLKKIVAMLSICGALGISSYAFAANHDLSLTNSVKSSLQKDPKLTNVEVVVVTKNGVVMVQGQVNSDTEASEIVQQAQSVAGVKDVDTSQLTVKESQQPMTDSYTTAKVKGAFVREKLFGDKSIEPMSITVETNNGVVYLSGSVDNKKIIKNAIRIAKSIKGVKSVDSKLTVDTSSHTTTE